MSAADIPGRAAFLWIYDEYLAQAPRGAKIVEVGVALGKSIAYLGERCIALGRGDIQIFAVDPWAGTARNGEQQSMGAPEDDFALFERMMREHAPEAKERISVIRKFSVEAAVGFSRGEVGLVVIDAAHDYESVKADIAAWRPKLVLDGWMGGDDYEAEYQGVIDAVGEAFPLRPREGMGPLSPVEVRRDQGWGTWLVRGAHI